MKEKFLQISFLVISLFIFTFAFIMVKPVETDLIKAFLVPNTKQDEALIKLANLSSEKLNVIFVAKDMENLEDLTDEFKKEFTDLFNKTQFNTSEILNIYKKYPQNFISKCQRLLLKQKNYKAIDNIAYENLYNPLAFYIISPDKDPYLFATDFVMQNSSLQQEEIKEQNGKLYSCLQLDIKKNNDIKKISEFQRKYKTNKDKYIILTGSPIHSFVTGSKSKTEINFICIISTLAVILFCKFYFRTTKILIPIMLSIIYGALLGFSVTSLLFKSVHILAFVFSTSLIGITLDYSLHYFLTKNDKDFKKNLTSSMITTVLAFSVLYFSKIRLLKQIAVFTSFGLFGVYLFVILILPMFKDFTGFYAVKPIKINKFKPFVLVFVVFFIVLGMVKLQFNDNIKNLYTPPKNLLNAEKTYQKVFNPPKVNFLIINGKNTNEILLKEEILSEKLGENNVKTMGLNNFISSVQTQKENQILIKELYQNNLKTYATFLTQKSIDNLITDNKKAVYNVEKFPLNSKFMLDKNTSFLILFNSKNLIQISGDKVLDVTTQISKMLKSVRVECLCLIPIIFLILLAFLSFNYGFKKSCLIITSPILGSAFALGVISSFGQEINLFHVLAIFLIIGFSLDYSIFRANGSKSSKDAVLISCISSVFSFLWLSMTSFKLISSLGSVLFIGLLSSYILSLFLISSKDEIEHM